MTALVLLFKRITNFVSSRQFGSLEIYQRISEFYIIDSGYLQIPACMCVCFVFDIRTTKHAISVSAINCYFVEVKIQLLLRLAYLFSSYYFNRKSLGMIYLGKHNKWSFNINS